MENNNLTWNARMFHAIESFQTECRDDHNSRNLLRRRNEYRDLNMDPYYWIIGNSTERIQLRDKGREYLV